MMDPFSKFRPGQPMIKVFRSISERQRVERVEQIFGESFCKMVNVIGERNVNPVILQRLRMFLYLYIKRVGLKFFCDVMSSEETIVKFLKLTVDRIRSTIQPSYNESKRVTSPSDTNFLVPRGGPDPSILPHYGNRRYQPYGQQPVRHQTMVHTVSDPFGSGSIPSPAVGESGRSPYHIDVASGNSFSDGSRSWTGPTSSQLTRLSNRDENIMLDLDCVQDFSSDLLEFLNNTSVLPELNFNTDLDFSVVRDDLDAMERCLFVRSAPSSDFSASNSPLCSSASHSPPTPRHFFPPNIQDDKSSSFSDSESSEKSVQIVPNVSFDRLDDERRFMDRSDGSNSSSPVLTRYELHSPKGRFLSSPLSAHMGQLSVNAQENDTKSVLRLNELKPAEQERAVPLEPEKIERAVFPISPRASGKPPKHRREACESSPPKRFFGSSKEEEEDDDSEMKVEEAKVETKKGEFKSAKEEILTLLEPTKKEECVKHIAKLPEKDLLQVDDDGDTQLMILVSSDDQFSFEQLYALVERLRHYPQLFLVRNKQGLTALFMAMWRNRPLVAGYLAETMADLSLDLGVTFKKGNTLYHYIATVGDDMAKLLAYLARVKKPNGKQAANFNVHNHSGRTVIHEAIIRHGTPSAGENGKEMVSCREIIEIMCAYGADPGEGDRTSGKGAVHAAVEKRDLTLIELLLRLSPSSANARMYNNNTPLHYAATLPNISEDEQFNIIRLLLEKGADKTLRNAQKKLPIELVCQEHQKVKMLLQARAKKQFRLLCSQQHKEPAAIKPP